MNGQTVLDWWLIGRCFAALLWGMLLACFLQWTRLGQYLSDRQMWFVTALGAGVNLLIGYQAGWWEIVLIFFFSSLAIVVRAFLNQSGDGLGLNAYKTKWRMEDCLDGIGDAIGLLQEALDKSSLAQVSRALGKLHEAQRLITLARYGDPQDRKR